MTYRNSDLAILGGNKTIKFDFKRYNSIGAEEVNAAKKVIESGVLSQYIGADHEDFYGGPMVKKFEEDIKSYFKVKNAITVNSWTSGLVAAVGVLNIEPGDEIIVSPWTMCASATSIIHNNAIPVFADIDPNSYCLDLESVEKNISPRTRAIMSIDIGGRSADIDPLMKLAKKYNLKVISDTAQSPGALYNGKFAGTLTDIGGYSLNYHKHIHTGEGGIIVTNDDDLAERMRLIRNHGEAAVGTRGINKINNMVGHNFRLGEIECAIGIEQLKKLPALIKTRQKAAERLSAGLSELDGLTIPKIDSTYTHVYYMYFMQINFATTGVSRDKIYDALLAEGVKGISKTFANLHLLPMYQNKIAFGTKGFPWSSDIVDREVNYNKGICPVAERLHDISYIGFQMCMFDLSDNEIDLLILAFQKVWLNLNKL